MRDKIKSAGINLTSGWLNRISDKIIGPADYGSLREKFGFWLQGLVERLFYFFFEGSIEELVISEDVPERHWNDRQRNFMRRERLRRGPAALIGYPHASGLNTEH